MSKRLELVWPNKEKVLLRLEENGKPVWGTKADLESRLLVQLEKIGKVNPDNLDNLYEQSDNLLIKGDNLLALKALERHFAGQIKCIYIDPPFNTGGAFEHYDDGLEHTIWLSMMKCRLELLWKLLKDDGAIFVEIDDDMMAHLKVIMDEIFGRSNFLCTIIWQKAFAPVNLRKGFSDNHDFILGYAKKNDQFKLNPLPRTEKQGKRYSNPDNDPRGDWTSSDFSVGPVVPEKVYPIKTPSGRTILPTKGRCWVVTKERYKELLKDNRIWFGKTGNNVPRQKKFLSEVNEGVVPMTIWLRDEVGDNQEGKREIKEIFKTEGQVFSTPKPERLIKRIIELSTKPGEWVLDSFLGSGTTAAVTHKLNRKWIGIEIGEHAETLCLPRLKRVVTGKDETGISEEVNWKGGILLPISDRVG
ncbi:MAG TPA: site-specific DNA-methyltransferase [Verrucomicrobiae bacterium]|nr:site-specific DNA-methyltransferase [Verrucomicrobiae bacterium]